MTFDPVYVWIWLPDATEPVVCGKIVRTRLGTHIRGEFIYGQSYLARSNALPLDPVRLPLGNQAYAFLTLQGIPAAILDAAPDAWGQKVLDRLYGVQSDIADYLCLSSGATGNLTFSHTTDIEELQQRDRQQASVVPLEELIGAAERLDEGETDLPQPLLLALQPGTGGARPKATIQLDGSLWIAKFPSSKDKGIVSNPKLEFFALQLAARCGIQTVNAKLQQVAGQDVLLVERFDRTVTDKGVLRHGFLSARTLLHANSQVQQYAFSGSYQRIASELGRYVSAPKTDKSEFFRRLCFNVIIGNTDDHEQNHGLIFNPAISGYALSPAFDIVPQLSTSAKPQAHALQIGDNFLGTRHNVLGAASAFDLKKPEAESVFDAIAASVENEWQGVAYECGFDDRECRAIEPALAVRHYLNDSSAEHRASAGFGL